MTEQEFLHLKTGEEVEGDFYEFILDSALGSAVDGRVHRKYRPEGSTAEEVVVRFWKGEDTLMQRGYVYCNIYLPNIINDDGREEPSPPRARAIQKAVRQFVDDFPCTDGYQIETQDTPTLEQSESGQWFINALLHFNRRAS